MVYNVEWCARGLVCKLVFSFSFVNKIKKTNLVWERYFSWQSVNISKKASYSSLGLDNIIIFTCKYSLKKNSKFNGYNGVSLPVEPMDDVSLMVDSRALLSLGLKILYKSFDFSVPDPRRRPNLPFRRLEGGV